MQIIEIILAANFFSFYFIVQNEFPRKWNINFKPFNCTLCLTAWVGLTLFWLPDWTTDAVVCMFGAGVIAPFFRNFLMNLYEPKRH
jgi:hypothetical protein